MTQTGKFEKTLMIFTILLLFLGVHTLFCQSQTVMVGTDDRLLKPVTLELVTYLERMYGADQIEHNDSLPRLEYTILLQLDKALNEEEYRVQPETIGGEPKRVVISGKTPRAVRYAIYHYLQELGCGFYLSDEIVPDKKDIDDLSNITIHDNPMTPNRIVFNWHNFLSGCSSWDFAEWQHYIDHAVKMRYNGLMTHFYANNPSFTFSHNGIPKVAGFLPNTKTGRSYGTQQVNDVTRLYGGALFDDPVFGSTASKVPDDERVEAAQNLMKRVYSYAESKSMNIWMAYDVDYALANTPEIVATLPEDAKITIKRKPDKYFGMADSIITLPVPDTPEGTAYYRSQIKDLFSLYPQIDNLVLQTRSSGSAFLTLKYDEFPVHWKNEFDRLCLQHSMLDKTNEEHTGRFATAKIYSVIRELLNESGRENIQLWAGSWRCTWMELADLFYPREVGFIPLDYNTDYFTVPEKSDILKKTSLNRNVLPVIWAHHDDWEHIGAPYAPYERLAIKVKDVGNSGVGIIHWTTRPLDIFFKNTEHQLWKNSQHFSIQNTAASMARRMVSASDTAQFADYMTNWIDEGHRFGRETRTYFINRPIQKTELDSALQHSGERIRILENITDKNDFIQYHLATEQFCNAFYRAQVNYQDALESFNDRNYDSAVQFLRKCKPESVIKSYARAVAIKGVTKGEQGMIIEMNLGWLPMIYSLEQTLGLKAIRYNLGYTNYPNLGVGLLYTNYFIDRQGGFWRNMGERECGGEYFTNANPFSDTLNSVYSDICQSGISSSTSFSVQLQPIGSDISPRQLKNPAYMVPGRYRLGLIFNEHKHSHRSQRIFTLHILSKEDPSVKISDTIDIIALAGGKNIPVCQTYDIELKKSAALQIYLTARKDSCLLNGIWLKPQSRKE